MAYIIKYNSLFVSDFFVNGCLCEYSTEPKEAFHFKDQDDAEGIILDLCRKHREGPQTEKEIIIKPQDFDIVWMD
jgi:hypothetical protein